MYSRIIFIIVFFAAEAGLCPVLPAAEGTPSNGSVSSEVRKCLALLAKKGKDGIQDGSLAALHHRLAVAYINEANDTNAVTHFGLAMQNAIPSQRTGIVVEFADFWIQRKEYHQAETLLRQAMSHTPHEEAILRRLARCLVIQEKVIEGLRYFKNIYPDAEAKEQIAIIYRECGNTEMLAVMESRGWIAKKADTSAVKIIPSPFSIAPSELPEQPEMSVAVKALQPRVSVIPFPRLQPVVASQPPAAPMAPAAPIPVPLLPARLPAPQPAVFPTVATVSYPLPLPPAAAIPPRELLAPVNTIAPIEPLKQNNAAATKSKRHYVINADATTEVNRLLTVLPAAASVPAE